MQLVTSFLSPTCVVRSLVQRVTEQCTWLLDFCFYEWKSASCGICAIMVACVFPSQHPPFLFSTTDDEVKYRQEMLTGLSCVPLVWQEVSSVPLNFCSF
jgi:hypothetical protein